MNSHKDDIQKRFTDAILDDNVGLAEELINEGADVNYSKYLLSDALKDNKFNSAIFLIKNGFKLHNPASAFYLAIENSRADVVETLLEYGAHVEAKYILDKTPLIIAIEKKDLKIIEILIKYKANFEAIDFLKHTIFDIALKTNNPEVFELVIKNAEKVIFNENTTIQLMKGKEKESLDKIVDILYKYKDNIKDLSAVDKVFVKLGRYEEGFQICKEMLEKNPNLANELHFKSVITKLDLIKTSPLKPLESHDKPHTNIEWIQDRIVIEYNPNMEDNIFLKTLYDIAIKLGIMEEKGFNLSTLQELSKIESLQEILDITALTLLLYQNFHIYSVNYPNIYRNVEEAKSVGDFSWFNQEILLDSKMSSKELKGIFIHEAWHSGMFRVFKNDSKPYRNNDIKAEEEFNKVILECLNNIAKILYNKEFISYDSTFELGKALENATEEVSDNITDNEINVADQFLMVYHYPKEEEHIEWIVRYEQLVAEGVSFDALKMLEPLKNYIDTYVKPAMHDYIYNHPMYHLLQTPIDLQIDAKDLTTNEQAFTNHTDLLIGSFGDICLSKIEQ